MTADPPPGDDDPAGDLFAGVREFTVEQGARPDIAEIKPDHPKTVGWDPARHAALVQAQLARRLIWVLSGVLVGGAALLATVAWTGLTAQDITDMFGVAFGAVVTLTTAATSFWFGSARHRGDGGGDQRSN